METFEVKTQTTKVIDAYQAALKELLELLSSFGPVAFNTIPFPGSWTAGQVGAHLFKSYEGIPQLFKIPGVKTERDPGAKKELIKTDFLDISIRMQSPEFIVPEQKTYDQALLLQQLSNIADRIVEVAEKLNMSEECTAFTLPVYGNLTRLEWMYFLSFHTQRHIHQLKKIKETVGS
jgi:hypothetical protein